MRKYYWLFVLTVVLFVAGTAYFLWSEVGANEVVTSSLCSQDDNLMCDRMCNTDEDCHLSCGCGCISKSEECTYAGVLCEAPGPYEGCRCVDNECEYFNSPP